MLRKFILILSFVLAVSARAQIKHMFDSIRYDLKQSRSLYVDIAGKNSIIRDLKLKMYGVQVGYMYNKRTNIHLGFYTTYNKRKVIYDNPTASPGLTDENTIMNKYGLAYLNLETEYYFFNDGKWRFSFPAGIGLGLGWDKFYKGDQFVNKTMSPVVPLEIGFNASYRLTWWLSVGAGLGTRISLIRSTYNGPFFTYGLQFNTSEIYKRGKKAFQSF